jgi:hypothetical protein
MPPIWGSKSEHLIGYVCSVVIKFTNDAFPSRGVVLLHVHPLLGRGLVNKFPRRQILGKQSVARLRNNSDNRRSVFSVVRAMPSAKQQNCKHIIIIIVIVIIIIIIIIIII